MDSLIQIQRVAFSKVKISLIQFDFGSLQYGQSMMNLMEDVSGDDEKALQSSIAVSNDCSMPSIHV
jgi:hypothetical protein